MSAPYERQMEAKAIPKPPPPPPKRILCEDLGFKKVTRYIVSRDTPDFGECWSEFSDIEKLQEYIDLLKNINDFNKRHLYPYSKNIHIFEIKKEITGDYTARDYLPFVSRATLTFGNFVELIAIANILNMTHKK